MKKSKLLSIISITSIITFILTFSISLPILFRPFYYLQIKTLNIEKYSGYDYQTIKTAYDEMLDYCIGISDTYSCGSLKFSQEGMDHFTDCRKLFILDFILLIVSLIIILILYILKKKKKIELHEFYDHSNSYQASKILLVSFITIVLLAIPDFDQAFTTFHKIFFPGKSNWLFDSRYDQIINILPETFFLNCALLIVASLFIICITLIIKDKKKTK